MKFSKIINYPLGLFGLKMIRKPAEEFNPLKDIEADKDFLSLYQRINPFTLTYIERCYALYQSVNYIIKNNIEGDFANNIIKSE